MSRFLAVLVSILVNLDFRPFGSLFWIFFGVFLLFSKGARVVLNFEAHMHAFCVSFGSHFDRSLGILDSIFHGTSAFSYMLTFKKSYPANSWIFDLKSWNGHNCEKKNKQKLTKSGGYGFSIVFFLWGDGHFPAFCVQKLNLIIVILFFKAVYAMVLQLCLK